MKKLTKDLRIEALKRFATAITVLNIVGHLFLGFEQSIAHMLIAMVTCYSLELLFEWMNALSYGFKPRFRGGLKKFVLFLLPGHITAMAISMLLFTNEGLMPVVFACAIAICSKVLLRVQSNGGKRHFLNPSNTGIAIILLIFPWVGIAPPYQFTENIAGAPDWILPLVFVTVGSFLNTKLTKRMPLILAWFGGFLLQALFRSFVFNEPILAMINPMTGVAFLLFSFYMISDPATTPSNRKQQVLFGLSVAILYSVLVRFNIVFGQFFALFAVCAIRGSYIWASSLFPKSAAPYRESQPARSDLHVAAPEPVPVPVLEQSIV